LSQEVDEYNGDEEMSFLSHLELLRWHLVRSVVAIFGLAIVAFLFKTILFDYIILGPMDSNFITYRWFCKLSHWMGAGDSMCFGDIAPLQSVGLTVQFTIHIWSSIVAGFIVAFPYVIYQFWSFIKPALKEKEKKSARGINFWIWLLFVIGVSFGFFLIVPLSVQFFSGYNVSPLVKNDFTINSYVSLVTSVTLATGLLFQLPVVMYLLTRVGLISPAILKKYRRHIIVVVVLLAAIITPPDVTSQILVAIPVLILYEVGIWISRRTLKRMNKKQNS